MFDENVVHLAWPQHDQRKGFGQFVFVSKGVFLDEETLLLCDHTRNFYNVDHINLFLSFELFEKAQLIFSLCSLQSKKLN